MKTFKDLVFRPHTAVKGAIHARLPFDNGTFIISLKEIKDNVTENTKAGVNGWLSIDQVNNRMRYLQTL